MKLQRAAPRDLQRILAIQKDAFQEEAAFYGDYSIPPLMQSLQELEAEAAAKIILKAEVGDAIAGSVRVTLSGVTCLVGRLVVVRWTPYARQRERV